MKRAAVFLRKKQFFVHAFSQTTDGVWIVWAPCLAVPQSGSDEDLGRAICAALEGSRAQVPHPTQWNGILKPLLDLAGVKSWTTFAKDATYVEVEEDAG